MPSRHVRRTWSSFCYLLFLNPAFILSACCIIVLASMNRSFLLSHANSILKSSNMDHSPTLSQEHHGNSTCDAFVDKNLPIFCCGHRGARGFAPENTLPSFQKAIDVGANCVELDIHRTKDGNLVVAHGRTVREKMNLTNEAGLHIRRLEDAQWSDVAKVDAGKWFSSEFEGEKIPTLSELVVEMWDIPVLLVVELKYEQDLNKSVQQKNVSQKKIRFEMEIVEDTEWEEMYAESLIGWISKEKGPNPERPPKFGLVFSSFNHALVNTLASSLAEQRQLLGGLSKQIVGLAYIVGPQDSTTISARREDVTWIAPHDSLVQSMALPQIRHHLLSWVTDSLPLLEEQVRLGVQAVTTNDPTLCSALCNMTNQKGN